MSGVAQRHEAVLLPLHLDAFLDQRHVLPVGLVLVLVGVFGIEFVEVNVLCIALEDCQSPGAMLVVADGHPWDYRFAPSDHIPSGGLQMDHVAQRRERNAAVWVVGKNWKSALGARSADDPIVAPFGHFFGFKEVFKRDVFP